MDGEERGEVKSVELVDDLLTLAAAVSTENFHSFINVHVGIDCFQCSSDSEIVEDILEKSTGDDTDQLTILQCTHDAFFQSH